jgi:CRISPR-associated protein Csd1
MILQALYRYYERLEERGETLPGDDYSAAAVSFVVQLDKDGSVKAVIPFVNEKGKPDKRKYMVPKQVKRTSGIKPYFLCDKAEYFFGSAIGMREACRTSMRKLWLSVLEHVSSNSDEIQALRLFVAMDAGQLEENLTQVVDDRVLDSLTKGGLCVLQYSPTGILYHQLPALKSAWEKFHLRAEEHGADADYMSCLITGERVPQSRIARLHPNIKNVIGAQSSGAAIVSFNLDAFCSYGLKQSYNAPVSQKAADAYGYVLNRFLADPAHKVRLNDTTVVFWAESDAPEEQEFLASLLQEAGSHEPEDEDSIRSRVRSALTRIRKGQTFRETFSDLNPDTRFYVLGLSPNAARLSVRFWYTGSLGEIGERVWQHYIDLSVQGLDRSPSVRELLRELAVQGDWENIPPLMEGLMLRSILHGLPYPRSIFPQLMNRIRAESSDRKLNPRRAALLKGYFIRQARLHNDFMKEANLTMAENENSTSTAYHLGRLFACLEKAQKDAHENKLNATISDRFWGAASTTPALVFPRLVQLSRYHVSKDEKNGRFNDMAIAEVMSKLPDRFPARLSLEEQGMFALGYFHKRQKLYEPRKQSNQTNGNEG